MRPAILERFVAGDRKVNTINNFAISCAICASLAATAYAKLPPPPEAAKEQAAEAAARTAWQDKLANYKLCLAQDRVAETYRKDAKSAGKTAPQPTNTPACDDPGQFVSPLAQKPLEASGAHSPPQTASTPPSQKATAAETMGTKKP